MNDGSRTLATPSRWSRLRRVLWRGAAHAAVFAAWGYVVLLMEPM